MVCALRRRQRHGKAAKDRPPTKTEQLDGTFSWDYAASRRRLANDEDLRLGFNCCAVSVTGVGGSGSRAVKSAEFCPVDHSSQPAVVGACNGHVYG